VIPFENMFRIKRRVLILRILYWGALFLPIPIGQLLWKMPFFREHSQIFYLMLLLIAFITFCLSFLVFAKRSERLLFNDTLEALIRDLNLNDDHPAVMTKYSLYVSHVQVIRKAPEILICFEYNPPSIVSEVSCYIQYLKKDRLSGLWQNATKPEENKE
jgi:hypothetical protein